MSTQSRIALVTGASRGIGQSIARHLGQQEVFVVGTATSEQGVAKIHDDFKQAGINGTALILDISQLQSIQSLFEQLAELKQMPSILVNNAGITQDNLLLRMKESEWEDIITTNLSSVYYLSKACLKHMMKNRWGRIINISSVVATTGNPGQSNYVAAKAGVEGFTRAMALEIASRNITVNAVAPGFIQTDMTDKLSETQKEAIQKSIPMGRIGQVEDIASVVSFLTSEQAGYITGQTIHVNGGMYM